MEGCIAESIAKGIQRSLLQISIRPSWILFTCYYVVYFFKILSAKEKKGEETRKAKKKTKKKRKEGR